MKTAPPEREFEVFTKAVLICAKGDGVLAPEERTWIAGLAACYNTKNSEYEMAKTYQGDDELLQLIAKIPAINNSGRRAVIYIAIKACAADGEYHPDERASVHKLAKYLGIEEDEVTQIEEICTEEAKIREKRIAALFPEGIPY